MRVVTIDENGQATNEHWVAIPKTDSFGSDAFSHIEPYVSRLLQSSASFCSVLIATPNQHVAVSLWKRGDVPEFTLLVDWRSAPELERAVRHFFSERKLAPSHDYLGGNGNVSDAIRCLGFFLPSDGQFITALTKDVLCRIYQLGERDALNFSFEEHGGGPTPGGRN